MPVQDRKHKLLVCNHFDTVFISDFFFQVNQVDDLYYIAGFGLISAIMVVFVGLTAFTAVIAMYLAAKHIHFDMIRNIFGAYLRFV